MAGADLEHATRVDGEDGRYVARLSDAWEIWGPNGGYLAAITLRAAGRTAQIRRPSSFYCPPNVDTSAWFHHFSPACEWLLADHACTVADHGLMAVDGKVWDTGGRLLATGAAHLCCIPNPGAADA